jgi:hypothetical protein
MRRSLVLFCACSLFAGLIATMPAGATIEKIMNLLQRQDVPIFPCIDRDSRWLGRR